MGPDLTIGLIIAAGPAFYAIYGWVKIREHRARIAYIPTEHRDHWRVFMLGEADGKHLDRGELPNDVLTGSKPVEDYTEEQWAAYTAGCTRGRAEYTRRQNLANARNARLRATLETIENQQ